MIVPPYSIRPGRSRRASAIMVPGMVLSQPDSAMTASHMAPRTASSIESAITSREISEARIPSVPMLIPSETTMVLNSIGVPPAARIPSLTLAPSSRRCRLQGVASVQVLATAMSGRSRSAFVRPVAFSMARAGARLIPFFSASLRKPPGLYHARRADLEAVPGDVEVAERRDDEGVVDPDSVRQRALNHRDDR